MQSILKAGTIADEDLVHEISLVVSAEQERSNKMKKVCVSEVSSQEKLAEESSQVNKKKVKENPLLTEINKLASVRDEIKEWRNQMTGDQQCHKQEARNGNSGEKNLSELASVREEIKEMRKQMAGCQQYQTNDTRNENTGGQVSRRQPLRVYKCEDCERNQTRFCNHCFKCGATDHRRNQCTKNP